MSVTEALDTIRDELAKVVVLEEENRMLRRLLTAHDINPEDILNSEAVRRFLDTPVKEYGLTVRTYNVLHAMGIKTWQSLLEHTRDELRMRRYFGRKCQWELDNLLARQSDKLGVKFDFGMFPKREITRANDWYYSYGHSIWIPEWESWPDEEKIKKYCEQCFS